MDFFGWLSATAVSFTVAGNTGVSPFLSLLLVGVLEKANPDLLNMGGSIEAMLSSWPSLMVLVVLTVLELVGKCIPVVDEIIDSAMAFILPVMSTLGSLSTFGLFHVANSNSSSEEDGRHRDLGVASGALIGFQIVVVLTGIVLAFSVHALKMTIRLLGTGWLTNCLTVLETLWIVTTITVAVFIRPIAILIAVCICCGAIFSIKRNFIDKRHGHNAGVADNQASLADNAHHHHHVPPDEDDDYVKIEDPCDMVVVGFDGVTTTK